MDRHWLLIWTTYGTWLPGDQRGFVGPVRDAGGEQEIHNVPGTPYDADNPSLTRFAQRQLKHPPIRLIKDQAHELLLQFHETARLRKWQLLAAAIMGNHVHLVAGVPGDPDPSLLPRDFKSYGSRRLNHRWSKPECGRWWTESGSKRKLPNQQAVDSAISYVQRQQNPLVIWITNSEPAG